MFATVRPLARPTPALLRPDRNGAAAFVWGVWAVLAAGVLAFVAYYGRNCPYMDEWAMLDALAGEVPPVAWAWEPHSEHRFFVPRLLYVGLFRLAGDLRAAMAMNALLLAASAAVLIVTAARVRGRASAADAFFPLVLLSPAQWEHLLMGYQVCFTVPAALAVGVVGLTAGRPARLGWKRAAALAACVTLLPTCGAAGVMLGAGAAGPLALLAVVSARRGGWGPALLLFAGAMIAGSEALWCVAHYPGSSYGALPRRAGALAGFAARLAAMPFGPAAEWGWPLGFAAVAAVGLTGIVAVWRNGDRAGVVGLLAVPAGTLLVAAGLAWGRGWGGAQAAFVSRYGLFVIPGAAAVYLIAVGYGGPRLAKWGPAAFALLAAAALPVNVVAGCGPAARLAWQMDALAADLRDGLPAHLVGERYHWQFWLTHPAIAADFERAERIGFDPFRHVGPTRPTRTSPLPIPTTAADGAFRLDLPPKPRAVAVRLRGRFSPAEDRLADFRVHSPSDVAAAREEWFQVPKNVPFAVVVRVDGTTGRLDVVPDRRFGSRFELSAVELIETE